MKKAKDDSLEETNLVNNPEHFSKNTFVLILIMASPWATIFCFLAEQGTILKFLDNFISSPSPPSGGDR
jgi:hypothetical protein